jgi:hypothetical protein
MLACDAERLRPLESETPGVRGEACDVADEPATLLSFAPQQRRERVLHVVE